MFYSMTTGHQDTLHVLKCNTHLHQDTAVQPAPEPRTGILQCDNIFTRLSVGALFKTSQQCQYSALTF